MSQVPPKEGYIPCPLCTENICEGRGGVVAGVCGHMMHFECSRHFLGVVKHACPVCRQRYIGNFKNIFISAVPVTPCPQQPQTEASRSPSSCVNSPQVPSEMNRLNTSLRKKLMGLKKEIARLRDEKSERI